MQFHLEKDELNLLLDILLRRGNATSALRSSVRCSAFADKQARDAEYDVLLEKVLAHDLRFDSEQLEKLADLLIETKRNLEDQIGNQSSSVVTMELKQELVLLERALEKVEEGCAMI